MAATVVKSTDWEPPARIEKDELIRISDQVLAEPDIAFSETEDIFRLHANGMDWDIGNVVYEPVDPADIATGPDGKKLAIFMTHGGASDWRSIEGLAMFWGKRSAGRSSWRSSRPHRRRSAIHYRPLAQHD